MLKYAKFLKEVLSNKRKLVDNEKVMLTEECSAILQRKLPPKLKDPRSYTYLAPLVILILIKFYVILVQVLI